MSRVTILRKNHAASPKRHMQPCNGGVTNSHEIAPVTIKMRPKIKEAVRNVPETFLLRFEIGDPAILFERYHKMEEKKKNGLICFEIGDAAMLLRDMKKNGRVVIKTPKIDADNL